MATNTQGNAFLQLLTTINDKAIPDPPTENDPVQKVAAPFEKASLSDTVTTTVAAKPFTYDGNAYYGASQYGLT